MSLAAKSCHTCHRWSLRTRPFFNSSPFAWTKGRPLLARPEVVALLLDSWRKAARWLIGRYVIMPDHLHLLRTRDHARHAVETMGSVLACRRDSPLAASGRKASLAKTISLTASCATARVIIKSMALSLENPIKDGLVKRPEDWPFQGELNTLVWHESV